MLSNAFQISVSTVSHSVNTWWFQKQHYHNVWECCIKEMHLMMKDDSAGAGHIYKRMDPEKYLPKKVRITMIQVAKGLKYDPKLVLGLSFEKTK